MAKRYNNLRNAGNPSAAIGSEVATQSDTLTLVDTDGNPYCYCSLYITGAGDVKFQCVNGSIDTITVTANSILPICVVQVFVTGTTATGIHGFI